METEIARVDGWSQAQWMASAMMNVCRINARPMAVGMRDTNGTYAIVTERKLRKSELERAQAVADGLKYGWRAFN